MDKTSDVIIVGGGVIGCAVAYFVAREGVSVTLFERDDIAAHASGAAAGMLAPICESAAGEESPLFAFGLRSLAMFPELTAELRSLGGVDPQYVQSGILRVAGTEAEAARLLLETGVRCAGHVLEWLEPDRAREREPLLASDLAGALWSPREGHVNSPLLALSFARAAVALGARIEAGVPVLGLIQDADRILGVRTALGQRGAGHVVLCAGVWTRFCAQWIGERLPLEPVRGQILALDAPIPSFRSIVWGDAGYLVPKLDGSVVVGATVERAGFDCRTTAAGLLQLLSAAPRYIPALAECSLRRTWAGLRPDTPDHLPVIGPFPGIEHLTVAAGHYRNGVLLSPATGRLVADWILRTEYPSDARPFLPQRLLARGR